MDDRLFIILLGNTGVGKSASGNTILGREAFESKQSFKSVTTRISEETGNVLGQQVSVVDTPGILCNGAYDNIQSYCEHLLNTPRRCLFLVVIKIDRFTEEQNRAVEAAIRAVGARGSDRTYLLFTRGDTLEMTLDEFIHDDDEGPLPQLVQRFDQRYLMFNNKHGGQDQVRGLLEKSGNLPSFRGPMNDRRILLFGLSGAGKSSSGNTILGAEKFSSGCDFEGVTEECVSESAVVEGRQVTVVDTPGFGNQSNDRQLAQSIIHTINKPSLGIHALVIVLPMNRILKADSAQLDKLRTLFGTKAAKYTMVLFTHGDNLRGKSIDNKIADSPKMKELLSLCSWRYCVFDNSERRNRQQVKVFLDKVDQIFKDNGGQCFSVSEKTMLELLYDFILQLCQIVKQLFEKGSSKCGCTQNITVSMQIT